MFPYLGFLITEDGECTIEFRTRLKSGQAIGASQHTEFNEDTPAVKAGHSGRINEPRSGTVGRLFAIDVCAKFKVTSHKN